MIRPLFIFSTITTLLVMLFILPPQATARAYRVAWITPTPISQVSVTLDTFRQEMRQRGYVEGENLTIELRSVDGSPERISGAVGELIRLNVDIIVAVAHPTVQAAQQATRNIPIVMLGVGDPVATGTVASLARPGGNVTGISHLSPELSGKRLELLKEALPGVSRVAVLWNPTNPTNAPQIRDTKVAAQALGIELQLLEVRAPEHLEGAFQAAARGRAGALITLDDLFIFTQRTRR